MGILRLSHRIRHRLSELSKTFQRSSSKLFPEVKDSSPLSDTDAKSFRKGLAFHMGHLAEDVTALILALDGFQMLFDHTSSSGPIEDLSQCLTALEVDLKVCVQL